MRKTTEELAREAGFHDCELTQIRPSLETLRRLCIENERECAKPVGVTQHLHELNDEWAKHLPIGTKLFTFPTASIDRNAVIEECAYIADDYEKPGLAAAICALKSQFSKILPCLRTRKTLLRRVRYSLYQPKARNSRSTG